MTAKAAKKDLADARDAAARSITIARAEQDRLYDFMTNRVHGANAEVNGREHQLIWAKIDELANPSSYPLWMDAVLTVLMMAVPVSSLVGSVGKLLTRSKKLMALPEIGQQIRARANLPDRVFLKSGDQLKALMTRPSPSFTVEYSLLSSKAWITLGQKLQPEITGGLSSLIKMGAKAMIEPIYEKDVLTHPKDAKAPDGTSLPSVAVFTAMLDWIVVSRSNDRATLDSLADKVQTTDDLAWLKSFPTYLEVEVDKTQAKVISPEGNVEGFQRFVEACLWCTTYDFTPEFKERSERPLQGRGYNAEGTIVTPARAELFPFPDAFWDNLIHRHYDPFVAGGTKTYAEIGQMGYVAPEGEYVAPSMTGATMIDTGMEFDARTRLSMHWSGIFAPALLSANRDMTRVLQDYYRT